LCKIQFKKELGWEIEFPHSIKNLCNDCAKTRKEAEELALTWGSTGTDRPKVRVPRFPRPEQ
jgi:hypothetical protein